MQIATAAAVHQAIAPAALRQDRCVVQPCFRNNRAARKPLHIPAAAQRSSATGPAYNKYRSRQDIERDYFKEFEEMTVTAEREGRRPMTILTLVSFLPSWFKFYATPGPLRFVLHLLAQTIGRFLYSWRKKAVLQGAKLDKALMQRSSISMGAGSMCRLALLRLHGKRSTLADLQLRWSLLTGNQPPELNAAAAAASRS